MKIDKTQENIITVNNSTMAGNCTATAWVPEMENISDSISIMAAFA